MTYNGYEDKDIATYMVFYLKKKISLNFYFKYLLMYIKSNQVNVIRDPQPAFKALHTTLQKRAGRIQTHLFRMQHAEEDLKRFLVSWHTGELAGKPGFRSTDHGSNVR